VAAEGIQAPVPFKGNAREVLEALLGGLRSGRRCSSSRTIPEMWEKARFVRQTAAGVREAGPHDVGSF
jgi:IMP dehydrogenase